MLTYQALTRATQGATYQNLYFLGCYLILHLYPLNRIQNSRQVPQVTLHPDPIRHFVLFRFQSILDLLLTLLILLQFLPLLIIILRQARCLYRSQILTHFLLTLTLNRFAENLLRQAIT